MRRPRCWAACWCASERNRFGCSPSSLAIAAFAVEFWVRPLRYCPGRGGGGPGVIGGWRGQHFCRREDKSHGHGTHHWPNGDMHEGNASGTGPDIDSDAESCWEYLPRGLKSILLDCPKVNISGCSETKNDGLVHILIFLKHSIKNHRDNSDKGHDWNTGHMVKSAYIITLYFA